MGEVSLADHVGGQLRRLCEVARTDPAGPLELLRDLLGSAGPRPLSAPPTWPSNIADDHTPVEFSLAFNEAEPPTLRILGETLGTPPGGPANMSATQRFLDTQARRAGLSTSRLDSVRDLFATEDPQGAFGLWCSLVFRSGRRPEFKVYLNPELNGVERAPALVSEALRRLGLGTSYQAMLDHGIRPGELGRRDRLTFFALDLLDGPQARVKLYLTHHDADGWDVIRAASVVDDADPTAIAEFCALAGGGRSRFDGLPLVGSYTLTEGADRPVGYSIYVPIRGYVDDDEQARDRVATVLARYGFDSTELDRALDAVAHRPLRDGVGLIPHVSLRLGAPRPGVTVYLSAEAYQVSPPLRRRVTADGTAVAGPAGRSPAGHP
ncbi:tryptophan dimethylallyltransferase family protein [Micromonospora sp. NPDC092111]|uniref:tryptophan dimethylallyltransferase family protein n=1 Tax=Micromonospora sp. NPDC092111 TaxID=3364289 RepID=UPI00380A06BC